MRRSALVVVLFVLLGVATVPGGAVAAASPDDPCSGTDGTAVRLFLDSDDRLDSDRSYYPRTTVTLYLCQDGDRQQYPTAWEFAPGQVDGISNVTERDYSVVFTLDGSTESVTPANGVEQRGDIDGPTIDVETGYRVESSLVDRTIRFPSEETSSTFGSAEDDWRRSVDRLRNASGTLSAATRELENGSGTFPTGSTNSSTMPAAVGTINDTDLSATTTALQTSAVPAARSGDGVAVAGVIEQSNETAAGAGSTARSALESYQSALEERRGAAVLRVRLFTGGGLVGGLLVGAVAGYALSRRTLSKVEHDRGVSTATQYSPRQVAVPVVLGVVALLVAVAVGALHWPALFEVIL